MNSFRSESFVIPAMGWLVRSESTKLLNIKLPDDFQGVSPGNPNEREESLLGVE